MPTPTSPLNPAARRLPCKLLASAWLLFCLLLAIMTVVGPLSTLLPEQVTKPVSGVAREVRHFFSDHIAARTDKD